MFSAARQITGAVHDLFTGTQHVRAGDFGHQIPVRARDQLGELAESFNLMTGEVTTLLGEMAEKGRMEQEMFAAREIQQKLLPAGPLRVTGLAMSAFCEPAREVAGDVTDAALPPPWFHQESGGVRFWVALPGGKPIGAVLSMERVLKAPVYFLGLSLPEHGYHAPNENYDWGQARGGMAAFADYFRRAGELA